MNHVTTVLESPVGGLGGGDSETNSPLFGGRALGSGMGTLGSEQVRGCTCVMERVDWLLVKSLNSENRKRKITKELLEIIDIILQSNTSL